MKDNIVRGIFLALAGNLCLSVMNACVRWLALAGYPAEMIIFFGGVISLFCLVAWMTFFGKWPSVFRYHPCLALYFISAVGACFCLFNAFSKGNLPEVATVTAASPFVIALLGRFLLKERLGILQGIFILIGFVGVLLVFRPRTGMTDPAILQLALLGVFLFACSNIVVRRLRENISPKTFILSFYIGVALIAWIVADFKPVMPGHLPVFLLAGMCDIGALAFIYAALKSMPATYAAPFQYSTIIWSMLFNFMIWKQIPDGWTLAGAMTVIVAGLLFSKSVIALQKDRLA